MILEVFSNLNDPMQVLFYSMNLEVTKIHVHLATDMRVYRLHIGQVRSFLKKSVNRVAFININLKKNKPLESTVPYYAYTHA